MGKGLLGRLKWLKWDLKVLGDKKKMKVCES